MREHQVIISLKTEQFEELQRLARAAGSRSLSGFARQKLLQALGISEAGKSRANDGSSPPDMKQLTGELRRLHRELKVFVAESLAAGDYPLMALSDLSDANDLPGKAIPVVEENFLAQGAPLMPITDYGPYDASLNPPAPNVNLYGTTGVPRYPLTGAGGRLPLSSRLDSMAQLPLPAASAQDPAALPYDEPQAPPDEADAPASSQPQGRGDDASAAQPLSQRPPLQAMASAGDDELEELAERAFAISPRLGPLEPRSPQPMAFPDPLKDLLDGVLTEDEGEEELPGEEELAGEEVLEEGFEEAARYEGDGEGGGESQEEYDSTDEDEGGGLDDSQRSGVPDAEESAGHPSQYDDSAADYDEQDDQGEDDDADQDDDDRSQPNPPPPPIPPFSGGPPPRKRST